MDLTKRTMINDSDIKKKLFQKYSKDVNDIYRDVAGFDNSFEETSFSYKEASINNPTTEVVVS